MKEIPSSEPEHKEEKSIPKRRKEKKKEENKKEKKAKKDQCPELHGFEAAINEKIAQMVDERLKVMIPCMKEQMKTEKTEFEDISSGKFKHLVHEGVECKGCGAPSIKGIRFKCLICPSFDLCESCENVIDHVHDLLKMKHLDTDPVSQRKQLKVGRQIFKRLLETSN